MAVPGDAGSSAQCSACTPAKFAAASWRFGEFRTPVRALLVGFEPIGAWTLTPTTPLFVEVILHLSGLPHRSVTPLPCFPR